MLILKTGTTTIWSVTLYIMGISAFGMPLSPWILPLLSITLHIASFENFHYHNGLYLYHFILLKLVILKYHQEFCHFQIVTVTFNSATLEYYSSHLLVLRIFTTTMGSVSLKLLCNLVLLKLVHLKCHQERCQLQTIKLETTYHQEVCHF